MSRTLAQKNGNDRVMTPLWLAVGIVDYFKPSGRILEPCCGDGSFLKVMDADWCEIDKGRDFFDAQGHWDWIVTNPPYSLYRSFLNKSLEVADNIVFLQIINALFITARLRDIFNSGYGLVEILLVDEPKEFPHVGFQLGCIHLRKGYSGDITFNKLDI